MCCFQLCCCVGLLSVPASILVLLSAVVVQELRLQGHCREGQGGICKLSVEGSGPATCAAGAWVEIALQPGLGLLHVPVGERAEPFAEAEAAGVGGCNITYSLACRAAGKVEVSSSSTCMSEKPEVLGQSWQLCASTSSSVRLLKPVVDLTFDIPTISGQNIDGCVRVSAPSRYEHLASVRGSLEQQTAEIIKKKDTLDREASRGESAWHYRAGHSQAAGQQEQAGDCPVYTDEESRLARSEDFGCVFGPVNAFFIRWQLKRSKQRVLQFQNKDFPKIDDLIQVPIFAVAAATAGGPVHMTKIFTHLYCGMPGPALLPVVGLQVTRHASLTKIIGDPNQKRTHQIGGGNAEFCFEPTLPVFLSAGEPLHTQARKLFDEAGLAIMHTKEIADIVPPPESLFMKVRNTAMGAVGMKGPLLDELAFYVAPLFLEVLWGKKPTAEEANTIAGYAGVGGPCIMSQVMEKLPVLPGKVLAIREVARKFGLDSPTGKKIATLLDKPEFAELKAMFAARPLGAVEAAVAALADVSLFAGLVGTSTMTMNAMAQINRGPQFLKMYRANSTAFLLETMRTAPAVAGSIAVLKEPWKLTTVGVEIEMPAGERVNSMTGQAGGLDGAVFPDPFKFDSSRPNLGEVMTFNGLAKHALSRDYAGAPRFCPGTAVSMKIVAKIIDHLTKDWA